MIVFWGRLGGALSSDFFGRLSESRMLDRSPRARLGSFHGCENQDNHKNYWKGVVFEKLKRIAGEGLVFSRPSFLSNS